jgi:hypothetical protein
VAGEKSRMMFRSKVKLPWLPAAHEELAWLRQRHLPRPGQPWCCATAVGRISSKKHQSMAAAFNANSQPGLCEWIRC